MKYISAAAILFYALGMVEAVQVEKHHHHKHHNVLAQQVNNKSALEILETGKETGFEEPAANEKVSKGNCCVPIKRTNQQVAITGATLAQFKADFEAQYNALGDFLYGAVNTANTDASLIPNQNNAVIRVLGLPADKPAASAIAKIDALTAGADAGAAIEIEHATAVDLFRSMVSDLMSFRNQIEFGLLNVKTAGQPNSASSYTSLRLQQKNLFDNVDTYFAEKLTPARFHYKVYSKLPINQNGYNGIVNGMKAKVQSAQTHSNYFAELDSDFQGILAEANGFTAHTIHEIQTRSKNVADKIEAYMNKVADHIASNNLSGNAEAMTAYDGLANALYRTKDNNKSALCFAYYAQKRRQFLDNDFWKVMVGNGATQTTLNHVRGITANGAINENVTKVDDQVNAIRGAVGEDGFDQTPQRKALRAYIKAAFALEGSLLNDQNVHPSNSAYAPVNAGHLYNELVRSMGEYRWGLSNLALAE